MLVYNVHFENISAMKLFNGLSNELRVHCLLYFYLTKLLELYVPLSYMFH